jgi:hypothetical protein
MALVVFLPPVTFFLSFYSLQIPCVVAATIILPLVEVLRRGTFDKFLLSEIDSLRPQTRH